MLALKMCRGPSLVQAETGLRQVCKYTVMKHWNGKTVIASIVLRAEMRAARRRLPKRDLFLFYQYDQKWEISPLLGKF